MSSLSTDAVTIRSTDLSDESAQVLLSAAEAELHRRYPEDPCHAFVPGEVVAFLVAYRNGEPVGCGALQTFPAGGVEMKRMFVSEEARGLGIGRRLVRALMAEAQRQGHTRIFLETGTRQPEAVKLYESEGFRAVPCPPEYSHPLSLCYEWNAPSEEG